MISEGKNISIKKVPDSEDTVISAQSSVTVGSFTINGETIEILADKHVIIKTAMPNKLIIGIDINKLLVDVDELKHRFDNLERVVIDHVKK